MYECFVSGVSAKIALYKYSSFPFLYRHTQGWLFWLLCTIWSTFTL